MSAVLLMLVGCGFNAVGRWEILAVNIGESSVADAGFVDMAGLEANRIYEPNAVLLRYSFQPVDGTFVPDPTPEVSEASTNAEQLLDGEATFNYDFPMADGSTVPATMSVLAHSGGQMVLEDVDFF